MLRIALQAVELLCSRRLRARDLFEEAQRDAQLGIVDGEEDGEEDEEPGRASARSPAGMATRAALIHRSLRRPIRWRARAR